MDWAHQPAGSRWLLSSKPASQQPPASRQGMSQSGAPRPRLGWGHRPPGAWQQMGAWGWGAWAYFVWEVGPCQLRRDPGLAPQPLSSGPVAGYALERNGLPGGGLSSAVLSRAGLGSGSSGDGGKTDLGFALSLVQGPSGLYGPMFCASDFSERLAPRAPQALLSRPSWLHRPGP